MDYKCRPREVEVATFYKSAIDYFLSIYPYMSTDIYSLELYPQNYSENGVSINIKWLSDRYALVYCGLAQYFNLI